MTGQDAHPEAAANRDDPTAAKPAAKQKPWWKRTWGMVAGVVGVSGVIFGLAQLPVKAEGFLGTVQESLNVLDNLRHPGTVVTFDRIGSFHFTEDRTLSAAIDAFGAPSSRERHGSSCLVRWDGRGVEAQFIASFGSPCSGQRGFFCAAELTGSRWKTHTGLRVDDSVARLRSLYPSAASAGQLINRAWRLENGAGGCPDAVLAREARAGGLYAITSVERVERFALAYLTLAE